MTHRRRALGLVAAAVAAAMTFVACDRSDPPARAAQASTTTSAIRAGDTGADSAEGCGSAPAGRTERAVASGGVERSYLLYIPDATSEGPRPLVVNIHGFGSNAAQQVAYTGIESAADRHGFVVVSPNATGTPPRFDLIGMGDVTFIGDAIDDASEVTCIDEARVYATGMSNGGALSSVLACRAPKRFAAIAPVAAVIYVAPFCTSTPPVPIMAFMGDADPVVPFAGGRVNCCGNPNIGSAPDAMAAWSTHNGCDPASQDEDLATDVVRRSWSGCDDGADTVFHIIEGGGHTWPGAAPVGRLGATTSSIDATEAIWDFFSKH